MLPPQEMGARRPGNGAGGMAECRPPRKMLQNRPVDSAAVEPSAVLAVWAAGLAAGAGVVAWWGIVGPGYTWLSLGVTAGFGAVAAWAGGGSAAWTGVALAVAGVVAASRPRVAAACAVLAAIALGVSAAADTRIVLVVTGAVFLGGVTSEMMLGHWYLVDPRLPRSALRTLDGVGIVGAVLDVVAVVALGALPWAEADMVMGLGWVVLAATTVLLLVGVWFSLGERGYSGVMAATGLSYLAVLTASGVVVLGRLVLDGGG